MNTVHGGLDPAELRALGLRAGQVLDFSSNVNPLGTSERLRRSAAAADLSAYPDRDCLLLREALSGALGVGTARLLVGNGATELIHLIARACLGPGGRCLIFEPTFGEYEAAAAIAGAEIHRIRAEEAAAFRWPVDAAAQRIREIRPRLVFLCNPNNPTGVYLDRSAVEEIRGALGGSGLLLLDDAYASLAERRWDPLPLLAGGGVAIVRSMTKDHALAGARLGYLVAEPPLVDSVRRLQPAWSVNGVAQAAGLAALDDGAHVAAAREVIRASKAYLCERLASMGLPVTPSATGFLLVRVGDAGGVRAGLLRRGIAVRDCNSFGLPEHIRIAVRRRDECARLLGALREVMGR